MGTSAAAIEAAIKTHLDTGACSFTRGGTYSPWLDCFIKAVAEGVYQELQNLSDTAGNPPSPTHT